jgi:hypothetical protein
MSKVPPTFLATHPLLTLGLAAMTTVCSPTCALTCSRMRLKCPVHAQAIRAVLPLLLLAVTFLRCGVAKPSPVLPVPLRNPNPYHGRKSSVSPPRIIYQPLTSLTTLKVSWVGGTRSGVRSESSQSLSARVRGQQCYRISLVRTPLVRF